MRIAAILAGTMLMVFPVQGQAASGQAESNKALVRRAFQAFDQGNVKDCGELVFDGQPWSCGAAWDEAGAGDAGKQLGSFPLQCHTTDCSPTQTK